MTDEIDPIVAMGRDAQLLAKAEQGIPSIRLYRWASLAVTLGRNQKADQVLRAAGSTPWAHRPTGGAAVLHGHDVTLTLAVPAFSRMSVHETYRRLAAVPMEFLRSNGVECRLGENGAAMADLQAPSAYCFAGISRNDIVDLSGRKVCGCAFRITKGGALLQTSIPLHDPVVDPASVIVDAAPVLIPPITLVNDSVEELPSWFALAARRSPR